MALARVLRAATVPAAPAPTGKQAFVQVPNTVAAGGRLVAPPLRWGAAPPAGKKPTLLVALCGPPDDFTSDDSDSDPFYRFMEDVVVNDFMGLLSELKPPDHLDEKSDDLKAKLTEVTNMVTARDNDKLACAIHLLRYAYGVVELAYQFSPNPMLPMLTRPPLEQFVNICLVPDQKKKPQMWGLEAQDIPLIYKYCSSCVVDRLYPKVAEADAKLMKSVLFGVILAVLAARFARCRRLNWNHRAAP